MLHTIGQWGCVVTIAACWLASTRAACDNKGQSASERFWEIQAINLAASVTAIMLAEAGAFQGMF